MGGRGKGGATVGLHEGVSAARQRSSAGSPVPRAKTVRQTQQQLRLPLPAKQAGGSSAGGAAAGG